MIKKIRVMLEYNTYCLWLYNENNEIIDNDNPPEWENDQELTDAFMAVSDLYDSFFVDNKKEFRYVGCPDVVTADKLKFLFSKAMDLLIERNNGRYTIQNDVNINDIVGVPQNL